MGHCVGTIFSSSEGSQFYPPVIADPNPNSASKPRASRISDNYEYSSRVSFNVQQLSHGKMWISLHNWSESFNRAHASAGVKELSGNSEGH